MVCKARDRGGIAYQRREQSFQKKANLPFSDPFQFPVSPATMIISDVAPLQPQYSPVQPDVAAPCKMPRGWGSPPAH